MAGRVVRPECQAGGPTGVLLLLLRRGSSKVVEWRVPTGLVELLGVGFSWLVGLGSCERGFPMGDPWAVTLGLYRNRSVRRIKGNQATFDNSQRNNLRSCLWGFFC